MPSEEFAKRYALTLRKLAAGSPAVAEDKADDVVKAVTFLQKRAARAEEAARQRRIRADELHRMEMRRRVEAELAQVDDKKGACEAMAMGTQDQKQGMVRRWLQSQYTA